MVASRWHFRVRRVAANADRRDNKTTRDKERARIRGGENEESDGEGDGGDMRVYSGRILWGGNENAQGTRKRERLGQLRVAGVSCSRRLLGNRGAVGAGPVKIASCVRTLVCPAEWIGEGWRALRGETAASATLSHHAPCTRPRSRLPSPGPFKRQRSRQPSSERLPQDA